MAYQPEVPYCLRIAQGGVSGVISENKFGRNPDVDVGTEDIWSQGGMWVAPTAACVHAIVSSSANDASAGTGARTISVTGLNGSYAITTETVTLNGTTPVNTANSYVIIHRMLVLTCGTGGTNAGTITATASSGGTVSIGMVIGKGQSQFCIYQIPAGYTAYLTKYICSTNAGPSSHVDVELFAKPFGGCFNLKGTITLDTDGVSSDVREYLVPLQFTEKTIIKLTATTDTNNCNVVGSFDLIMVAN